MLSSRSLLLIAVRRMLANWRLELSVIVGALVASALISATAIYADAIRDLGLQFALSSADRQSLDVSATWHMSVDRDAYQRSQDRLDRAVADALQGASGSDVVRTGTSATFFPTDPSQAVSDAPERPRAFLRYRSELDAHVTVLAGVLPSPAPLPDGGRVPVAIGAETAARSGIGVGARLDLHPFWNESAAPLPVEVVGIVDATDAEDPYWRGRDDILDDRSHLSHAFETYALLVPEETFYGAMPALARAVAADISVTYGVAPEGLNSRNASAVAGGLRRVEGTLSDTGTQLHVRTGLPELLDSYDEKLFFTRIPLFVLLVQIGAIVAYYLVVVSTMLVERQANEVALMRSRGASTAQLLFLYAAEGAILAALAVAAGPPIAAAAISALGPTPPFSALSGGELLDVHISGTAYLLAAGGALLAFSALMAPAWGATHRTVTEFKRARARPRPTPPILRYYLDVALVLVTALAFWRFSQQDELFTRSLFGDLQVDPFLLLAPAIFLVTVGIVFLRLFPLMLRAVARLVGLTRSTAVLVGMRSLVRNPTHYTRLILLLMFATGVGMFGASFSTTLDRSYRDRAAYAVGADVRASDLRGLAYAGGEAFLATVSDVPADVVSPAVRVEGELRARGQRMRVEFLGIEPETFRRVGYFRDDFSESSFDAMQDALEANAISPRGVPLPDGARQVGAWVKMPEIRGSVSVAVMLRDGEGKLYDYLLGTARPEEPITQEWRFLAADLNSPRAPRGLVSRAEPPAPPLFLDAYYVVTPELISASQGRVLLGPVLATTVPPSDEEDTAATPLEEAFAGAVVVHDFASTEGFEVIDGYRPGPPADSASASTDAPPAFEGSVSYAWEGGARRPPNRGLQLASDGEPMTLFLSRRGADELGLGAGDEAIISVGGKFARVRLAGVLDYFPTFDLTSDSTPFAVVNLSRLEATVNAAPTRRPLVPTEVWYRTSDPATLRAVLESDRFDARVLMDADSERLRQERDPLIAAGWRGILAIAFGAVLLLSAIGFLVYSYLTAQQRALEFAILRTLGFSRWQVFSLVAFEHVFVIVAGMGLGTAVGLQVGRMMLGFLATDERGQAVLPPFVLGISWPAVFLTWGVLGAVFVTTIATVVLLYWRLAVHRALRMGDA